MKNLISLLVLALLACGTETDQMQNSSLSYLALGDSYTIGESVAEDQRWPVQLANQMKKNGINLRTPKIIATTGWRTDQLKEAIENASDLGTKYDLVSLLIGVNNQYQGRSVESFAPEFEELLQKSIDLAGGNVERVFVLSIPDYGKTPFGAAKEEQIGKELDAYNQVSKEICARYDVAYFDITPISREAKDDLELIAEDKLHPSGKMYKRWVDLIFEDILTKIKK
jgi:lysophospholipase L1-like esterase